MKRNTKDHSSFGGHYQDPFQSPRANPKHSYAQVNGETEVSLHNYVLRVQAKKRAF